MNLRKINTSDYCCCLTGHGHFHDAEELDLHRNHFLSWGWMSDQGDLTIAGLEWDLFIGISHNEEEWRQTGDVKEFLLEAVEYLEALREAGSGRFSLDVSYSHSHASTGFELSACTAGLLSALNIGLGVRLNKNAGSGGDSPSPIGDLRTLTGDPLI